MGPSGSSASPDALDPGESSASASRVPSRARVVGAHALVVVGAVLLVVSLLANFVRREALDSGSFEKTSRALIADSTIQNAVATRLVNELLANPDASQALAGTLPPKLQELAGAQSGAPRDLVERATRKVLELPRLQELFVNASVLAQKQVAAILEDDATRLVRADGGTVVLNLRPLLIELGDRIGLNADFAGQVPPSAAQVTLVQSDDLESAQGATSILETVADWMWVLVLLAWAGAIWLVPGRRLRMLRHIGIAVTIVGVVVLLARALGISRLVDHLVVSDAAQPAGEAVLTIVSDSLAAAAWTVLGVGLLTLLGTWLAGSGRRGTAARRRLAPYLARPVLAYVCLAVAFGLLAWWSPLLGRRNIIILGALAVIGFELLRRRMARDQVTVDDGPSAPAAG